jgi:hypothetical protein
MALAASIADLPPAATTRSDYFLVSCPKDLASRALHS